MLYVVLCYLRIVAILPQSKHKVILPLIDILEKIEISHIFIYLFIFGLFAISWAAPAAYGGSQARSLIRAVDTSLRQSHSNAGSEPRVRPTPQLKAMPDH